MVAMLGHYTMVLTTPKETLHVQILYIAGYVRGGNISRMPMLPLFTRKIFTDAWLLITKLHLIQQIFTGKFFTD